MNYAPLVRLPYNDVSGIVQVWAGTCESMAVYEHTPDQGCASTHIHMIMIGCKYKTAEQLKKLFYKMYPDRDKSEGNGLWSWTNKDHPVPNIDFVTYMSKGVLRPKYVKNISEDKLEELRGKWSEPTPRPLTQTFIETKEKPKITKHTLMLKVVNLVLSEHTNATELQRKAIIEDMTQLQWIKAIRKVLIEEKQMLGLYKVIDLYDACMMYYCKEKFISNCLYALEKRVR